MKLPYDTTSVCGACYRHIPATVHAVDDKVYITKTCEEHGTQTHLVENSLEFFNSLTKTYSEEYWWDVVLIEVTDRCNLACPHCYHLPDNRTTDRSIESIVEQVKNIKCDKVMFAGAEPTVRKDFIELVRAVRDCGKVVHILTNGVKLADEEFVLSLRKAGVHSVAIGLNHADYQGKTVHFKQLQGIRNCVTHGIKIAYIGYTLENEEQLIDTLHEIQAFTNITHHVRIRFGSRIGRVPNEPLRTLSDNYTSISRIATKSGFNISRIDGDDNIYHIMLLIGKMRVRLIQWPNVDNIILDELATGPWCQFYDGPVTNFVHQVITRDGYKNLNLKMLDECPAKYHYAEQSELYKVNV